MIQNFSLMISLFFVLLIYGHAAMAGPYTDSAHGNSSYGVNRTDTAGFGYARGNCAHCHEQHASIGGSEPEPVGGAQAFCVFYKNFNTSKTLGPYSQSDDFCFYCHCYTDAASLQTLPSFTNYDYSHTFGGYNNSTPASIYAAFNQDSYHNLHDIWDFAEINFSSFFKSGSNPCVACHNPHLAKRNKENPGDPGYTAISKPTTHAELWGDSTGETMNDYAPSSYQAPYRYSGGCEPDGGTCSDLTGQAQKTPDYVTFCQDCHSYNMTGYGLLHTPINWSGGGDKHGEAARTGTNIKLPYDANGTVSNYVLSCLDCHEPHGSYSYRYLIRKELNGGTTAFTEDTRSAWDSLCIRCHQPHNNGHYPGQLCSECHYHDSGNF
jgi:cytochrome c553